MRNISLLPFVFKVKGAKKYAFFDLRNHRLFKAGTEGSVEEVKKFLLKKELAVDTTCVIPFKFHVDVSDYKKKTTIRELQIRLTGRCDQSCRDCGEPCCCFKGDGELPDDSLGILIGQLKNLSIHEVVITGGNPLLKPDALDKIKKGIPANKFKILSGKSIEKEEMNRLTRMGYEMVLSHKRLPEITESKIKPDAFSFFYNQEFNPCWGNMIAIDVDGTIKPCLWADDAIGNIHKNNIRELIIAGKFDSYWELTKDEIETCKTCEYRYGCPDCRVSALKQSGVITAKTDGCNYDPESGK